ncbi:LLM class flavin-dependent oxidoreductase [soil metagenome]
MGLGFGLLSAQLRPGETDWRRAYADTIDLAVDAERLGFDSIWTTEHHFVDDGYMPSLLVVSGALAAVTSRVEIGTGVVLAPLHHPLRLAEDAATAQLLSGGRLTLGLGLGWNPIEYEGFGADLHRRGKAMEEILTILPRAWSGQPFRHQGEVYEFPELGVRPAPHERIPILIGGGAEPAIRRAGRLADGLFSNADGSGFIDQVRWATDELERVGRDVGSFRFVHYSILVPSSSTDRGWSDHGDHLSHLSWKYSDMEASATRPGSPPAAPAFAGERSSLSRSTLVGTSGHIVDELNRLRENAGVPVDFVARSFLPTLSSDLQAELMGRLATEVAPHV